MPTCNDEQREFLLRVTLLFLLYVAISLFILFTEPNMFIMAALLISLLVLQSLFAGYVLYPSGSKETNTEPYDCVQTTAQLPPPPSQPISV